MWRKPITTLEPEQEGPLKRIHEGGEDSANCGKAARGTLDERGCRSAGSVREFRAGEVQTGARDTARIIRDGCPNHAGEVHGSLTRN